MDLEGEHPYEISIFISATLTRNQLLVLHTWGGPNKRTKSITSDFTSIGDYDAFKEEGAFPELQKDFIRKINSFIKSTSNSNPLKTGQMVPVLIDFIAEENNTFGVSIYAGEIGILVDPKTDPIEIQSGEYIYVNKSIDDNEILVYFRKWGLLETFRFVVGDYKGFEPFEKERCLIGNKAFLLSLSAEDTKTN